MFRLFLTTVTVILFFSVNASINSNLEHKVIHAVKETDCLEKFDYSGQLSASNNENECDTGGMKNFITKLINSKALYQCGMLLHYVKEIVQI